MNNIGIIVDGAGDYTSLRKRFKNGYKIIKTDGPRGHCVSAKSIVSKSRKQINLLKMMKCNKIIVLLDFECRDGKFDLFSKEIETNFKKAIKDVDVVPCLANTMIENWYLADISYLSKSFVFLKKIKKQKCYEGLHGKKELKKMMKKTQNYNEIKHGAQLFEKLRFKEASELSPSLKSFLGEV